MPKLTSDISLNQQDLDIKLGQSQPNIKIELEPQTTTLSVSLELPNDDLQANIQTNEISLDTSISNNIVLGVKDVRVNGVSVVHNKIADITIPTKLSEFEDDLDYTRMKVQSTLDLDAVRVDDFIFLKKGN